MTPREQLRYLLKESPNRSQLRRDIQNRMGTSPEMLSTYMNWREIPEERAKIIDEYYYIDIHGKPRMINGWLV